MLAPILAGGLVEAQKTGFESVKSGFQTYKFHPLRPGDLPCARVASMDDLIHTRRNPACVQAEASGVQFLAGTMQSEYCLALTLSLSPGRGDRLLPYWKNPASGEAAAATVICLPLLGGEGRGEGECFFPLNGSGLGRIMRGFSPRVRFSIGALLALVFCASAQTGRAAKEYFEQGVRPLVKQYCLGCHSTAKHKGDLDLERFTSLNEVMRHPGDWERVVEQLSLGEMPPEDKPQPTAAERARLLAGVNRALDQAAMKRAGDPGPVVLRRLNNAEYTYTVRDLTGVDSLNPAKEFPADSAAGEGFMNTGNTLVMSPTLITKYLDAGKAIASHAVLLPDGIRFSAKTTRRDWTDEILARIRSFYDDFTEPGGIDTVTQQGIALDRNKGGALPLAKYLAALLELRDAGGSPETVARERGLSAKYLGSLEKLLSDGKPSPLLDGLRARWRAAKPEDAPSLAAEIGEWQKALWKFSSVGQIGKTGGPKAWMEPVTPLVAKQELRVKLTPPASGDEIVVYLAAGDAGDGPAGDFVVWQQPKLLLPGQPPIPLREARAVVGELLTRRERVLASTARALAAAAEAGAANGGVEVTALARRHAVDESAMKAWLNYLGIGSGGEIKLDLFTHQLTNAAQYGFVNGWGSAETPLLLANSSDQPVRIPGNVKPHGVVVHPSPTLAAAVGWRSPVTAAMRIEATVTRAHPDCGKGVTWSLEARHGGARWRLAEGVASDGKPVVIEPLEKVAVQPGDMVSLIVGPREGDHTCGLTDLEFKLRTSGDAPQEWSLTRDVSDQVLSGNPHADGAGRAGVWHFYTEPIAGLDRGPVIPPGSLLARWQAADQAAEKQQLAGDVQRMLTSARPPAGSPDAELYDRLLSPASPLFLGAAAEETPAESATSSKWGLDPALFGKHPKGSAVDGANLCVQAPSVIEIRLPASLVAGGEFVTTGALDPKAGTEGSAQLQVLTTKPDLRSGAPRAGEPITVNDGSAARKRFEDACGEFRQMFPAALCYTKIVPVDEVVTLTLFHREDEPLARLLLDGEQKGKLDRMWDELHYVSQDALTLVDAFEQLWQFSTQDGPNAPNGDKRLEPLREPINRRAAEFKQRLTDTQPRHLEAVLEFAGRAYRRPLTDAEKNELRGLYRQFRREELPHDEAVRLLLARVLVAPAFLYRLENAAPGPKPVPVSDWELANRLSYFLWSSAPDAGLRTAAADGRLHEPAVLMAQTRRMLRDPRVRRLATEFGCEWLHIHDFESLDEKSERHFPSFTGLRGPMYEEAILFLTDAFQNDAPVLSLFDTDHAFLNESLARHYGIPGVTGAEWRRVEGVKQFGRGGILGLGATLAKQSGASRTSPILRGDWVSEVLLGEKVPRPPKNVPHLPEDEATETLTIRQLTEKHVSDPLCAGCHARFDGYGYALEGYDAIGRLRSSDLGGRPIDTRAVLFDGATVAGAEGLREYLLTRKREAVVRQFCRKLLGYSLGRGVILSDRPLLAEMQAQLRKNDYRFTAAIETIVRSQQFREIRGRDNVVEE